jgi:cytidylate kinase
MKEELRMDYNAIKEDLQHVYFINGTAYAGKSTVCKILAKKHNMFLCEENYMFNDFLAKTKVETHPHMNYFKTMSSWEEFVTRDKYKYEAWMDGVSKETTEFEIKELLRLPRDRKIIVDTNIPHDVLKKISDENHVVYMVSTTELAMKEFFEREDKDKQFILSVIKNMENSEEVLNNYKETIRYLNRQERIDTFKNSGFLCVERKKIDEPIDEKIALIEKQFKLR